MADERLTLVAEVQDKFTGPLRALQNGLRGVQSGPGVKALKDDLAAVHGGLAKTADVARSAMSPALLALGVTGLGAAAGISAMAAAARSFVTSGSNLAVLSRETGMAADELRKFEALGGRFGISADTMGGASQRFAENLKDIKKGYGETFGWLMSQGPEGAALAQRLRTLDPKQARDALVDFMERVPNGIDRKRVSERFFGTGELGVLGSGLLGSIKGVREQVDRNLGSLPKGSEETAAQFQNNFAAVLEQFRAFRDSIAVEVLPPITRAMEEINRSLADPATKKAIAESLTPAIEGLRSMLSGDWSQTGASIKSTLTDIATIAGTVADAIRTTYGAYKTLREYTDTAGFTGPRTDDAARGRVGEIDRQIDGLRGQKSSVFTGRNDLIDGTIEKLEAERKSLEERLSKAPQVGPAVAPQAVPRAAPALVPPADVRAAPVSPRAVPRLDLGSGNNPAQARIDTLTREVETLRRAPNTVGSGPYGGMFGDKPQSVINRDVRQREDEISRLRERATEGTDAFGKVRDALKEFQRGRGDDEIQKGTKQGVIEGLREALPTIQQQSFDGVGAGGLGGLIQKAAFGGAGGMRAGIPSYGGGAYGGGGYRPRASGGGEGVETYAPRPERGDGGGVEATQRPRGDAEAYARRPRREDVGPRDGGWGARRQSEFPGSREARDGVGERGQVRETGPRLKDQGPVPKGQDERALRAMDRLIARGWKPKAAATAVGQAVEESGVRSDGPLGDTARFGRGDDAAHGMFQWRAERFRALKAFSAERKKPWADFDTQVDFFDEERKRRRSGLERDWHNETDFGRGNLAGQKFEQYAGPLQPQRERHARRLFGLYNRRGPGKGVGVEADASVTLPEIAVKEEGSAGGRAFDTARQFTTGGRRPGQLLMRDDPRARRTLQSLRGGVRGFGDADGALGGLAGDRSQDIKDTQGIGRALRSIRERAEEKPNVADAGQLWDRARKAGASGGGGGQMNVNGGVNIRLSPDMPAVKANTSVDGTLFRKVELDRGRTMPLASTAA